MSELLKSDPVQESLMGAIAQTLGSASEMSQDTILRFQNGFKKSIDNIQNRTTDSSNWEIKAYRERFLKASSSEFITILSHEYETKTQSKMTRVELEKMTARRKQKQ